MENPIILLTYLLESFCIITFGGVLFDYSSSQNLKAYLKIGLILGLFTFIVRNTVTALNLPILIHIPFTFLLSVLLIKGFAKFKWVLAILISVVGFISALLNEMIFGTIWIKLLNLIPENVVINTYDHLKIAALLDVTYIVLIPLIYFIKNRDKMGKGNINDAKKISSIIK